MREAADEIERLRKDNFSLAAWQCVHWDGKTGLVNDEHGNQYCAKDKEIERLREALKPFAEEATHWVNYSDSEPMVESFPDYEGNVTVGNCRRAFDVINKVR